MQTVMSRSGAFLRALVLLGAVAVAIPWLLVTVAQSRFGGPAPWSGVPPPAEWSGGSTWSAIGDRMSESTLVDVVIRVGLTVAWIAVIVVLATVVAETIHMARHRGLPRPPLRGIGAAQGVARIIASGLLVVLPVVAAPGHATARHEPLLLPEGRVEHHHGSPEHPWPETAPGHAAPETPATGPPSTYVVKPGDSVYGIAGRTVGSDQATVADYADRLLELNLGRQMNDGQWFTNAAYIDVGWEFELPPSTVPVAPDPSVAVVAAGDSLWSIADARLGDGHRWPEIYELNQGRVFDDGRVLVDPDLIQPGWVLHLPTEAVHPDEVARDADVPAAPANDVPAAVDDSGFEAASPVVLDEVSAPIVPAAGIDEPAAARPENVWLAPPVLPDAAPADPATDARTEAASGVALLSFERAAMLSAGVLALLAVRRRAMMRRTPPGARWPQPTPAAVATERALRAIDPGERFARVDIAIRHAAVTLVEHDARVEAATVADDGDIELWVSRPVPLSAPWSQAGPTGARVRLPAGTPIELLVADARRVGAPCPTLVQLGRDAGGHDVYVDLEALGVIEVGGPGDEADAIVNAVAATLSASVFAEVTTLIGVGVPDDAFLGHRRHIPARDVRHAFEEAADAIGSTAVAERSTFELRAGVTSGETWEPAVVLAGSAVGTVTLPTRRTGLAVVSASPVDGAASRLAPDGDAWTLLPIGLRFVPIGLRPADTSAVAALATPPRPVRGALSAGDRGPDSDDTIVDDSDRVHGDDDDGGDDDLQPLTHSFVVRLFGPVAVETRERVVVDFERSKTRELIAWLATHRERSTRSNARGALWEIDVRDATFANVVSEARRALARAVDPPDGEEWVARTMTDALPLHPLVVTDLELIGHALSAARLQPPDLAIATLRPAVDLVAGVPFEGTSYLWPDAEGITSELVLRAITVTNAMAAHCLSVGDIEGVFAATARGLRVIPAHEDMIAVRMRAYALAGDRAGVRSEWESYERAIVSDSWSDGEPSERMVQLRRELLSG